MAASKPSVRIDEALNETHLFEAPENPKSMWISLGSRHRQEQKAKEAGRESMLNGYALLLDGTYDKPHLETQKCLDEFVRASGARGLEKVICQSHKTERKQLKAELFRSVFEVQELAKKNEWHDNERSERLCEQSMKNSLKGKLFARKMAVADEAACSSGSTDVVKRRNKGTRNFLPLRGMVWHKQTYGASGGRWRSALLACF